MKENKMKLVYALEELPESINKSIFLAGPSVRTANILSWRKEALRILEEQNYDGVVFIPETRDGKPHNEYDHQVNWEDLCLNVADSILFWIPRDLEKLPGFITNIEWGRWENSGKVVLGYPDHAAKMGYIKHYALKEDIVTSNRLEDTIANALAFLGEGAERKGGDRYVPLHIWKTPQFQSWHASQTKTGNYLVDAKVLYAYHHIPRKFGVFLFILRTHIFIKEENRVKKLDFTLARTDISSVLLYKRGGRSSNGYDLMETEVVLVKEFRPSVSNSISYVVELPSGSNSDPKNSDPFVLAQEEVHEETGFDIAQDRLKFHGARQLMSTLSTHKSHLFSAELTEDEMTWFRGQKGIIHGNVKDGEQTYIEVFKVKDLWEKDLVDWSGLGQIMMVVNGLITRNAN